MTDYKDTLNEAFRLCHIYHKRYGVYPVRIGVHASQSEMEQFQISPSMRDADIPFVVDANAKQGKLYFYGTNGKYTTSTYLNAIVFVPLAMLPEAIQHHYRKKAS